MPRSDTPQLDLVRQDPARESGSTEELADLMMDARVRRQRAGG
jgi:hypothetical protein